METLGLVKELEKILESCQKVVTHLKPETMNLQTMQWDIDQKHQKIVEANQTLKELDNQIKAKKDRIEQMEKSAIEKCNQLEELKRKELISVRAKNTELEALLNEAKKKKHLETVSA